MRTSKSRAVWSWAGVGFDISEDVPTDLVLVDCVVFAVIHHELSERNTVSFPLGCREESSRFQRWLENISILRLEASFVRANWYQEHACQTRLWHSTPVHSWSSSSQSQLGNLIEYLCKGFEKKKGKKEVNREKMLVVHSIHSQNLP